MAAKIAYSHPVLLLHLFKNDVYSLNCEDCTFLTAKDGEKIFVKRIWVKEKPHLFYNEQAFTQDGKHSE